MTTGSSASDQETSGETFNKKAYGHDDDLIQEKSDEETPAKKDEAYMGQENHDLAASMINDDFAVVPPPPKSILKFNSTVV